MRISSKQLFGAGARYVGIAQVKSFYATKASMKSIAVTPAETNIESQ